MERYFWGRALVLAVAACAVLGGAGLASAAVVIDTVPVGDAGNTADSTGYGQVGYAYNIGKYEVTAGQYTEFLNAVAATDTYGLFGTYMAPIDFGSGITQNGSPGSYHYDVNPVFVNRPVNHVNFWDACRFANWLNNGQGGAGTTEYGAYALNGVVNPSNTSITRNTTGVKWAVTSEDEWYKAAYYKGGGTNGGYWLYPIGSDTAPGRDMADVSGNNANYYGNPYPIQSPNFTTVAGEFQNSDSPYGTFDQGGNVWEWNEAIMYGSSRAMRGAAFNSFFNSFMESGQRGADNPVTEGYYFGFRVVQIPEPASLALLGVGVIGMMILRRGAAK